MKVEKYGVMVVLNVDWVTTRRGVEEFIAFGLRVYAGDAFYRDHGSSLAKAMMTGRSQYAAHADCRPLLVREDGGIKARAVLISDQRAPDYLMLGFFEAVKDAKPAVDLLLATAREYAAERGYQRVVVGLNGHFANGMGFLASHFEEAPVFGFPYNPSYYPAYFAGCREHRFSSYALDMAKLDLKAELKLAERVIRAGYSFREADFAHLRKEAGRYTAINNAAYPGHIFWTPRDPAEDWELIRSLRAYLRPENLLFAEKDGEAVGYLLWYPDFNQTAPAVNRFRLGELCLKPEHQGSGAVLGLICRFYEAVLGKYSQGEAGWIFSANQKSGGLVRRWEGRGASEYKQYRVYEMSV